MSAGWGGGRGGCELFLFLIFGSGLDLVLVWGGFVLCTITVSSCVPSTLCVILGVFARWGDGRGAGDDGRRRMG